MDTEVIIAAVNIIQRSRKRTFAALSTVLEAAVTLLDAEDAANSLSCIIPDETLVRDVAANGEYRFGTLQSTSLHWRFTTESSWAIAAISFPVSMWD